MGTLLPENLCAHRKGAIEELIMGRARDTAAQQQILFGKPTGDHDGPQELLVKLLTSFAESLSHLLMSSCEDCQVSQIRNHVRTPIGDQRSVVPGGSSRRPAAKDRTDSYKRRCTDKHDQGCQATGQVQRIQEAPHMYPTNHFWHHSCRSYSVNKPSQNPLLEAHLRSFSSKTISTQDSDPYSLSFSSKTISTQDSEPYSVSFSSKTISTQDSEPYSIGFSSKTISTQDTSSCPSSASSVRKECGEETTRSNSLSGNLPVLPCQDETSVLDLIRQHLLDESGDEKREGGLEVSPLTPSSWAAPCDWSDVKGIFDVPPLSPLSPLPTLSYSQLMVI